MRVDFYKLPPYARLRWDITENGESFITGKKSIIFAPKTRRDIGFHMDPERATEHVDIFPEKRTHSNIIRWMVRAGYFSPVQSVLLFLFPWSSLLRKFVQNRGQSFNVTITAFTKKHRQDFENYLRSFEETDHAAWIEEIDPCKMPEDEEGREEYVRKLEERRLFPIQVKDEE